MEVKCGEERKNILKERGRMGKSLFSHPRSLEIFSAIGRAKGFNFLLACFLYDTLYVAICLKIIASSHWILSIFRSLARLWAKVKINSRLPSVLPTAFQISHLPRWLPSCLSPQTSPQSGGPGLSSQYPTQDCVTKATLFRNSTVHQSIPSLKEANLR